MPPLKKRYVCGHINTIITSLCSRGDAIEERDDDTYAGDAVDTALIISALLPFIARLAKLCSIFELFDIYG